MAVCRALCVSLPLARAPCDPSMSGREDLCRLDYINTRLMQEYHCTTPWLLNFARYTQQFPITAKSLDYYENHVLRY